MVVVNWNRKELLRACLKSVERQVGVSFETIVVDNGSADGSAEMAEREFAARVIRNRENRGFCAANNQGIAAAEGEFVALLNNDTEADPNWASAVIDAFTRHAEIGSVASKMLLFDQRDHIHTAGDYFTRDGRAGNRGVWQKDDGQFDREEYVFSACGGSSAYRRTLLDQVGLLDDDFFFSLEDVDLGWRAQLAGWRCLYTPAAIVYHHLSATGGGVTASYYDGRNLIYVLVKVYPFWGKDALRILRAQMRLAWDALRSWRGAAARARLRGMIAGLRGVPLMLRKRRLIQTQRRATDAELEALLMQR